MKKLQKIIFSFLAVFLIVQATGMSTLFAQDDLDEEIVEQLEEKEEIVESIDDKEELEEDIKDDITVIDDTSDLKLGNFELTFKDYTGEQKVDAYVKTGTGTAGIITYNSQGEETIPKDTLTFRMKFPKGSDVKMNENINYAMTVGSETSPLGQAQPDDPYTYIWLTLRAPLTNALTETITFEHTPNLPVGQLGTDDKVIEIEMDAFEIKESSLAKLPNHTTAKIISYADLFGFGTLDSRFNYTNQSVTTKTDGKLQDISFTQRVYTRYSNNPAGLVHTSKIIYNNTYKVQATSDNNPYIKFKRTDIVKLNGDAFSNAELSATTDRNGYVTSFTVITEAVAPAGQQLTNPTAGFIIKNANLDKELVQTDFNVGDNSSQRVEILNESSSARAIPVSKVSGLSDNQLDIPVPSYAKTGVTYTNAAETGHETENQSYSKRIISIANTATTGQDNKTLAAYKNDIVVYDYASGWSNLQDEAISKFEIVEYADHASNRGYKSDEIRPIKITTGTGSISGINMNDASVELDVIITYKDGTTDTVLNLAGNALSTSQSYQIPTEKQDEVSSIRYVYKNVDSKFRISSAPTIQYRVLGGDVTKQGLKINNSVDFEYQYKATTVAKESPTVYFRYRDLELDKNGVYSSNKSGQNLTRNSMHELNDVFLFSIEIENNKNDATAIKTIHDQYSYNLSPFDGTMASDAVAIDAQYLADRDEHGELINADNMTNLVVWKEVEDDTDPNGGKNLIRLEDQTIIESLVLTPNTNPDSTEYGTMLFTFTGDGIALAPREKIILTYTMQVNDRFIPDATIGNVFEANDKDDLLIGKGEYWKGAPSEITPPDPTNRPSYNKSAINATGNKTSERPFANDIVIYTLTFDNKVGEDWENIIITDTYSSNLSPYHERDGISDEHYEKYGLRENGILNFGFPLDKDNNPIIPENFDIDQVKITVDDARRTFTIDLGDNVLLQDEKLQISYTMYANDTVIPKETIINRFVVEADNKEMSRGYHYWASNDNATHGGIVSNNKAVDGIDVNGRKADTQRLMDGEKLAYTVTLSNHLPRANREVTVKNIVDYMPDYVRYVPDTFKLVSKKSVLNEAGNGYDEEITEIDPSLYTMNYDADENKIEVRFNDGFKQAGGVNPDSTQTAVNQILMTYEAIVDSRDEAFATSNPFKSNESRKSVTNRVFAFYKEDASVLVAKNGSIHTKKDDDKYTDNDSETKTYTQSNVSVQVLNENNPFGWISKNVTKNKTVDVLSDDDVTREYKINTYNSAFRDFKVTHVVDLLPEYETVNEDVAIKVINNVDNEEYEAVYKLDTVIIEDHKYNRLTVTGYMKDGIEEKINLPAITIPGSSSSMSIVFETTVDKQKAREDLYLADQYSKSVVNRAAMYTDEEITTFVPQGLSNSGVYKRLDDHIEGRDWDSDEATSIRYETSASASIYSSAIVPYMDVRAQIVEVTGSQGTTYRNAMDTDFIDLGEIVGWKVSFGNSNMDNTPEIKAGSTLILELPVGLTFEGYSTPDAPAYLDEIQVSDQNRVLIWEVNEDLPKGTLKQFIIRTTTSTYDTYTVDGYFIPKEIQEYGFFKSKVFASNEYRRYNTADRRRAFLFEPNFGLLPDEFNLETSNYHYLKSTESVRVLGNLSIGGRLSVETTVGTASKASTNAAPYFITLADVSDSVKYSMYLDVYKLGTGVEDIVLINRLAGDNDRFVLRDQYRRSDASMVLDNHGYFEAQLVNATTGSLIRTLDPSEYEVQYAVQTHDYNFTENDWDRTNDDIWMSASELLDAGYEYTDVSATRTVIDNAVSLEMNEAIKVSYLAKLQNYHNSSWEAYNSYAYGALVDGASFVRAETRSLGVKSPVKSDRLRLTTELIDPALTPLRTDFELEVVAYEKDTGLEAFRTVKQVTVSDVAGIMGNISWIEDIDRNYRLEVFAKAYDGFRTPSVTLDSETDQNGLTVWDAHIIYERIIYDEIEVDVEVKTINNKYPISSVKYELKTEDDTNTVIETENRSVSIVNGLGSDNITTKETGNNYAVVPEDLKNYTVTVEPVVQETLDTTGIKHSYKIVYTQKEEKPDDKTDGKKDPNTGIEDKTYIYVGILILAISGVILFAKKSKKKDS